MNYTIFSKKEILKQNKELLELHKRCVKTHLVQCSLKYRKIKQFFIIYDYYINTSNITSFFFSPVHLFVQALLLDQLDEISNYIYHGKKSKKRRNRKG